MIGRAFAATVFKEQQIAARCLAGYWFGTCGVTGKVTPLAAGAAVGFAGAGAGVAAGAGAVVPLASGVVVVVPPAGAVGAVPLAGAAGLEVPTGPLEPGRWLSTPLPEGDVAGRSRMSIGFSPYRAGRQLRPLAGHPAGAEPVAGHAPGRDLVVFEHSRGKCAPDHEDPTGRSACLSLRG